MRRLFFFAVARQIYGLFYILFQLLCRCLHQLFNVAVLVTNHFEIDAIACAVVTVAVVVRVIENVNDFSVIHPFLSRLVIGNAKCGVGI